MFCNILKTINSKFDFKLLFIAYDDPKLSESKKEPQIDKRFKFKAAIKEGMDRIRADPDEAFRQFTYMFPSMDNIPAMQIFHRSLAFICDYDTTPFGLGNYNDDWVKVSYKFKDCLISLFNK